MQVEVRVLELEHSPGQDRNVNLAIAEGADITTVTIRSTGVPAAALEAFLADISDVLGNGTTEQSPPPVQPRTFAPRPIGAKS